MSRKTSASSFVILRYSCLNKQTVCWLNETRWGHGGDRTFVCLIQTVSCHDSGGDTQITYQTAARSAKRTKASPGFSFHRNNYNINGILFFFLDLDFHLTFMWSVKCKHIQEVSPRWDARGGTMRTFNGWRGVALYTENNERKRSDVDWWLILLHE